MHLARDLARILLEFIRRMTLEPPKARRRVQLDDALRHLLFFRFAGELPQRLQESGDVLHAAAILKQQEDLPDSFRRLQNLQRELRHEELRELLVSERGFDITLFPAS